MASRRRAKPRGAPATVDGRVDAAQAVAASPWFAALPDELGRLVLRSTSEKTLAAGEELVRAGDEALHWIGVVDGLLHMWITDAQGRETTLAVIGAGEWCGEGSLLKRERYRYNAIGLVPTRVVLIHAAAFERMRQTSLEFNHAIQHLMNERMSGFVELLLSDRLLGVEARVERSLRLLARKQHQPGAPVTVAQQQFALLCGLSRQRVNLALARLEAAGRVQRVPQGVRVLTDEP